MMNHSDERDWRSEIAASEERLVRRCELQHELEIALDRGYERMAEAIRRELESLEE